jgi:peptidoglycan/LPS O-acetylase OafA/YrhL
VSGDSSHRYMPGLDGLRALSILMVIYSHLSVTHVLPRLIRASTLGSSAVIIFFVLSGFLITSQLKAELKRTGTLHLRDFYIRRVFRLIPALLLMLGVAEVMGAYGLVPISHMDVIRGLTYTADYFHPVYWSLAHLWSLSVEEQFYILWPVLLVFAGLARSRTFAIAAIILCPIFRTLGWFGGVDEALVFRRFEMVADSLAFGCLLAVDYDRIRESRLWRTFSPSVIVTASALLILAWSIIHRFLPAAEIAGRTFISLGALLIIAAVAFFPESTPARLLSLPPLVWIGKISYTVYLWQQMFLVATPGISKTPLPFPLDLVAVFLISTASYYLYELPIRRFGRRITQAPGGPSVAPEEDHLSLKIQKVEAQP